MICKVNKKLGRIRKEKKNIKGKHNKLSQDNIIQKIKASFHEKIFNYINKEYEKFVKEKYQENTDIKLAKILIKRICPTESKKIKKKDNLTWFSLKLKDLFSLELSSKYSNYEPNYNKKQIDNLYRKNEAKNVIDILEKTVREMFNNYSHDIPIDGFETLKDDLLYRKKKMDDEKEEDIEEYLKRYKEIAQNLEQVFLDKKSRGFKK